MDKYLISDSKTGNEKTITDKQIERVQEFLNEVLFMTSTHIPLANYEHMWMKLVANMQGNYPTYDEVHEVIQYMTETRDCEECGEVRDEMYYKDSKWLCSRCTMLRSNERGVLYEVLD